MTEIDKSTGEQLPPLRPPRWAIPIAALAVGILLLVGGLGVLTLRYDQYAVPDEVMSPIADRDSEMLVAPRGDEVPNRGDIVVVDMSAWPGEHYAPMTIRRVIGVGGDRVSCCTASGQIQVNGQPITEDYLRTDGPGAGSAIQPFDATVPDGRLFLLGDRRGHSVDSVGYLGSPGAGSVPVSAVPGTVVGAFSLPTGPEPFEPTSAFTDAGLSGSSTVDRLPVYAWWAAVAGLVLSVLASGWVMVVSSRFARHSLDPDVQ